MSDENSRMDGVTGVSMEEMIFDMLKRQVAPEYVLNDIAMEYFSLIRTQQHLDPDVLRKISMMSSFSSITEEELEKMAPAEDASMDEQEAFDQTYECIISSKEIVEYRLESIFDEAEDEVKRMLMEEPLRSRIAEDLRRSNVLMLNPQITEDQIELLYVGAFRKLDVLKERLQKRIMELSPLKAYYQGQKAYEKMCKERHFLMDDDDLLNAFHKREDEDEIYQHLFYKTYLAMSTGRHYSASIIGDEEDDDEDSFGYDQEEVIEGLDMLPPNPMDEQPAEDEEILLEEDGDLKDCSFEYAMELFSEYTGRRVYDTEETDSSEEKTSYWSRYEDEMVILIHSVFLYQLEDVLNELIKSQPEKLKNLAFQYDISPVDYTNPVEWAQNLPGVSYYLSVKADQILDHFGMQKMEHVLELGKQLAEQMPVSDEDDEESDIIDFYNP